MLEEVRTSCAAVAARATQVTIDLDRLTDYAGTFSVDDRRDPVDVVPDVATDDLSPQAVEDRVALVMALDTVNFGSGYHPFVHKDPDCSGSTTMASRLRRWCDREGPVTGARLRSFHAADAHEVFAQPADGGPRNELMGLFASALRELGELVLEHDDSFTALVTSAGGSADQLVAILDQLPSFRDRATYRGRPVLFFKRAQITAADLARALHGRGPGHFTDLDRLTAFADNLVPHVLRVDGVLRYDPGLLARIDAGELLDAGGEEEIEIRAAGVHAVELLRAELAATGPAVRSSRIDEVLWTRGGAPRYKAEPRHRTRSVFY